MFRRIKSLLFSPSARYSVFTLLLFGMLIGAVAVSATLVTVEVTGTNAFCASCHELKAAVDEYQASIHYTNRTGVKAGCADCHLTHVYPKKIFQKMLKLKDVWHHLSGSINTPEKYEKKRLEMANAVWERMRKNNSETCRSCHDLASMTGQSDHATRAHRRAARHSIFCIQCHIGVAHKLPDLPLPEAAKPLQPGGTIQCGGCHVDITRALSENHPVINNASLAQCIKCHVPGAGSNTKEDTFYRYMHTSHKNRIACTGCHKVTEKGMSLIVAQ